MYLFELLAFYTELLVNVLKGQFWWHHLLPIFVLHMYVQIGAISVHTFYFTLKSPQSSAKTNSKQFDLSKFVKWIHKPYNYCISYNFAPSNDIVTWLCRTCRGCSQWYNNVSQYLMSFDVVCRLVKTSQYTVVE